MGRLFVEKGKDKGKSIVLRENTICLVGRDLKTSLRLRDLQASRRHLKITCKVGGEIRLEDLDSSNGTFVNGERIRAVTVLSPGDVVRFGTSSFAFETVTTGAYDLPEPIAESVRGGRRGVAASRMLLPEILTYIAIAGTSIALILYFALR